MHRNSPLSGVADQGSAGADAVTGLGRQRLLTQAGGGIGPLTNGCRGIADLSGAGADAVPGFVQQFPLALLVARASSVTNVGGIHDRRAGLVEVYQRICRGLCQGCRSTKCEDHRGYDSENSYGHVSLSLKPVKELNDAPFGTLSEADVNWMRVRSASHRPKIGFKCRPMAELNSRYDQQECRRGTNSMIQRHQFTNNGA
jgi:hypothetical protein